MEVEILENSKVELKEVKDIIDDSTQEKKNQGPLKKSKIKFTEEKETLLITLVSKVQDTMLLSNPKTAHKAILGDKKALEIYKRIDYDFNRVKVNGIGGRIFALRAKIFDDVLKKYINLVQKERACKTSEIVIVQIGVGMDSRFDRMDDGLIHWIDVDFPEVIKIRKDFFEDSERYKQISSDATNFKWMECLKDDKYKSKTFIFIAEGCFPYIAIDDVRKLACEIQENFSGGFLIFDSQSKRKMQQTNRRFKQLKKTGASLKFYLDDEHIFTKWNKNIAFVEDITFWDAKDDYCKMGWLLKVAMDIARCLENCYCCCNKRWIRSGNRVNVYKM